MTTDAENMNTFMSIVVLLRGKSLLELWVTNFLPDSQSPLIFVRFILNFLRMCSISMESAHVILK